METDQEDTLSMDRAFEHQHSKNEENDIDEEATVDSKFADADDNDDVKEEDIASFVERVGVLPGP